MEMCTSKTQQEFFKNTMYTTAVSAPAPSLCLPLARWLACVWPESPPGPLLHATATDLLSSHTLCDTTMICMHTPSG